jgi:hypothetical protein
LSANQRVALNLLIRVKTENVFTEAWKRGGPALDYDESPWRPTVINRDDWKNRLLFVFFTPKVTDFWINSWRVDFRKEGTFG